ncbi:hypothetical protein FKY81_13350, partial [Enterococcus faecalis]
IGSGIGISITSISYFYLYDFLIDTRAQVFLITPFNFFLFYDLKLFLGVLIFCGIQFIFVYRKVISKYFKIGGRYV